MNITGGTTSGTWNGALCGTCGKGYLGSHQCAAADLLRKAAELTEMAQRLMSQPREVFPRVDRTASCPCRPENGGSGICGCIMGGMTITCQTSG
jgi:hypothetical protein